MTLRQLHESRGKTRAPLTHQLFYVVLAYGLAHAHSNDDGRCCRGKRTCYKPLNMSRRSTSWLGGLLGGSEQQDVDRFSVEHLRHLRDVLIHNPIVTDANRDAVVEALRSIAELMVWGDQHDPKFLEYFLENNILQHFTNILQQRSNRRGEVAIQVLQTLSMLIQVTLVYPAIVQS